MVDPTIKNLIFDLGGVILDLSVDKTIHALSQLSGLYSAQVIQLYKHSVTFNAYERGDVTDSEFRNFIRSTFAVTATDQQIDNCWNAMLCGIPLENLTLLSNLKNSYQVILLSNTNNIHLEYINNVIMPVVTAETSLASYFHRMYYSHLMNMRKPDAEIFNHLLIENNLIPEETLFLDDNEFNLRGAAALGIKTAYVTHLNFILEYFHA